MRWLLLTDLHIGVNNESQELAIRTLIEAIKTRSEGQSFNLVLMTGDLAFSGKASEYTQLQELLINPLRDLPEFKGTQFVAVPGNHDVDCELSYPPSLSTLGPKKSEQFFYLNDIGRRIRKSRSASFAAYSDFLSNAFIEGVDPTQSPGSIISIESDTAQMQLICVVTSFFSSKDLSDEENQVPAPLHPIRHFLTNTELCPYRFVVAHHPPGWFTPECQQRLRNLLVEQNAVYLHGHEHKIQAEFGINGLTSLGFGAVYQASLENRSKSYYRNSFAICQLDKALHIAVTVWDSENGTWVSENKFPANFNKESNILSNGRVLPLPASLLREHSTSINRQSVAIKPTIPHLTGCYWLANNDKDRWRNILCELSLIDETDSAFKPPTQNLPAGHIELRINEREVHTLIHAVSGHGDVFSYDQIVALNTLFDLEQLTNCIVVTLGDFADDAMTLVNRLSSSKSIQGINRKRFERLWVERSASSLVKILKDLDVTSVSATLLIIDDGYAMMLMEQLRSKWFQIIDEHGSILPEVNELVSRLRQEFPNLGDLEYRSNSIDQMSKLLVPREKQEVSEFSKKKYLSKAYEVFDSVRYAPLAALGFRFRNASLSDIYIETSAGTGGAAESAQTLQRAVSEYVESLNLDQALRDQLESQLRSRHDLGRGTEVGLARQLYQKYSNVVVLGDPGSGKTCFVKYEILAYCKPPSESKSWYDRHLPIYIPLAEAADLLRSECDFFSACVRIAARRKMEISEEVIRQYLSDGRAAVFLDGLDEVSRIDERVTLMSKINELITKYARHGNRFVLTSRPAAIQPVDIPDEFSYLHLKGLTDQEIKILGERVLTTRLGASEDKVLATEEREVIKRLLEHVKRTPGLRRISRNPLLLTLLVLIYANTGKLSARRHVVYTHAVKTLVSYRHGETNEKVLPEADLRTRLGRLAYAIYNKDVSEFPSRTQVVNLLLQNDSGARKSMEHVRKEAQEFLRNVAEATGLLVIHTRDAKGTPEEDIVSFMHHSFLEYYAAIGFLAREFSAEIPQLATHPHWRDIITLMFGLLSEHQDISSLLTDMVEYESRLESVTNERLRLGFECALECETPPRESQELLAGWLSNSLTTGALRHSEHLREVLANLVDRLFTSAGVGVFEEIFLQGIENKKPIVSAAFIDFLGRLNECERLGKSLIECFERNFDSRKETVIRAACAGAIMRRAEFRTERSIKRLGVCFEGTLIEKHAAIKAIENNPSMARRFQNELITLLDDSSQFVATSAAHCILITGLPREEVEGRGTAVRKAVAKWQTSERNLEAGQVALEIDGDFLRKLLKSTNSADATFAANLVPLGELDNSQAHKLLLETLRKNTNHQVMRACLDSLRNKDGALDLITLAETDFICGLVKSKFRDVRIGAIRVLAQLPSDERVVSTLKEVSNISGKKEKKWNLLEEVEEGIKALSKHAQKDNKLRGAMIDEILSTLPNSVGRRFGNKQRQFRIRSILSVCEKIGGIVDEDRSSELLELAKSFRTPMHLRAQALRVYGRTVRPKVRCVGELIYFLERNDAAMNEASYAAVFWFLVQCRKRVKYIREVYPELPRLRKALVEAWAKEKERLVDRIDSAGIENIRRSVAELESIIASYSEFSEIMRLAGSGTSEDA